MKNGIFVVRFTTMEKRDQVLASNPPFFHNRPTVMKAWDPNIDMSKDGLKIIPIWINMFLDFKYWGEACINKIVGQIGIPIKVDQATLKREKLQFARMLIEVKVYQFFPEFIYFVNEVGIRTSVKIEYDWKHMVCTVCKGMGHTTKECKKASVRKERMPKPMQATGKSIVGSLEVAKQYEEFMPVRKPIRRSLSMSKAAETLNGLDMLEESQAAVMVGQVQCAPQVEGNGGCQPPVGHG